MLSDYMLPPDNMVLSDNIMTRADKIVIW
jgi:hypothetical protein